MAAKQRFKGRAEDNIDAGIAGRLQVVDKPTMEDRLHEISIFDIFPDPMQPRRVLPVETFKTFRPHPMQMQEMMAVWISEVGIPVAEMLQRDQDDDLLDALNQQAGSKPAARVLLNFVDLAITIRQTRGIVNPITVQPLDSGGYVMESGERRWYAYHLLAHVFGQEWEIMPALFKHTRDIWGQAAENNARENLNAIAKARQYALLVMGVIDQSWKLIEDFESDVAFYAQVVNHRLPAGTASKINAHLGVKNRTTRRRIANLLNLSSKAWNMASDYDVPESVLRDVIGKGDAELAAINDWLRTQSATDASTDTIVSHPKSGAKQNTVPVWQKRLLGVQKLVTPNSWHKLNTAARQQLREELSRLLDEMDALGYD